jgi:hypothetical protein
MSDEENAGQTRKGKRIVFAEVVSYAPEARRVHALSIVHVLILLFFFFYLIAFTMEAQYIRWLNVYLATIFYTGVGGLLIVIAQCVTYIMYSTNNKMPGGKRIGKAGASDTETYMGTHHTRELNIGGIVSLIVFLFVTWFMWDWLQRFHKTCEDGCDKAQSNPDPSNITEWAEYRDLTTQGTLLSLIGVIFMIPTCMAHFNPLRVITRISSELVGSAED